MELTREALGLIPCFWQLTGEVKGRLLPGDCLEALATCFNHGNQVVATESVLGIWQVILELLPEFLMGLVHTIHLSHASQ